MKMQLNELRLRNFKGLRDFTLKANGKSVSVFGDNATGKTTLFDAFTWLLFDKDSQSKATFEIKTLDEYNNVIHGLDNEVEGAFDINGRRVTLRKVYKEKWQKKRGSVEQEFTGHTTDYYIDGVPVKKKEFTDFIANLVDEDVFKLLTSPTYFNEVLHWEKRRETLLQVCGDVSDEDVIASSPALARLPEILQGRSIENHRKVIAARRKEINEELQKLPIRIDEVHRGMPDLDGLDEEGLQKQIDIIKGRIEAKESELSRIQSGGEVAVKEKRLREIEGELLQLKNELQAGTLEKVTAKRQEVSSLESECNRIKQQISDRKWSIERNTNQIEIYESEADRLRRQWHEVNAETFEHEHDENCPTCGQELPQDQIQTAHDKALARFNRDKAERLERITKQGKEVATEVNRLKTENADHVAEIAALEPKMSVKQTELSIAETELKTLQNSVVDIESDQRYIAKKEEISAIQQEINELRDSNAEAVMKVRDEIADLRNQVDGLEQEKAKFAQVRSAERRIEELKAQERELAAEYERLEEELYLTEEFTKTKVNLLESKINSKFKLARFKLFRQQVNGGIEECCETLYNGVPFSSLNNAARINVGLDIINTLSEHYDFSAPIFIDNAEAVTQLIETTGQQVRLVVSEKDKKLRVELEEKSSVEVA